MKCNIKKLINTKSMPGITAGILSSYFAMMILALIYGIVQTENDLYFNFRIIGIIATVIGVFHS